MIDVENQYKRGSDGYLRTFISSYDMLVNFRNPQSTMQLQSQDGVWLSCKMAMIHNMTDHQGVLHLAVVAVVAVVRMVQLVMGDMDGRQWDEIHVNNTCSNEDRPQSSNICEKVNPYSILHRCHTSFVNHLSSNLPNHWILLDSVVT